MKQHWHHGLKENDWKLLKTIGDCKDGWTRPPLAREVSNALNKLVRHRFVAFSKDVYVITSLGKEMVKKNLGQP